MFQPMTELPRAVQSQPRKKRTFKKVVVVVNDRYSEAEGGVFRVSGVCIAFMVYALARIIMDN